MNISIYVNIQYIIVNHFIKEIKRKYKALYFVLLKHYQESNQYTVNRYNYRVYIKSYLSYS